MPDNAQQADDVLDDMAYENNYHEEQLLNRRKNGDPEAQRVEDDFMQRTLNRNSQEEQNV